MIASIEIERLVLGKILCLDEFDHQSRFINMCSEDDFFSPVNKRIHSCMMKLIMQGRMTDPHIVFTECDITEEELADILVNKFDSNETLKWNIKSLHEYAVKRGLDINGRKILDEVNHGGVDFMDKVLEIVDDIDKKLMTLKVTKQRCAQTLLTSIVMNMKNGGSLEGRVVAYGIPLFDKMYKHERGHTHTIGAQPSVGKTALALTIARGVLRLGGNVFGSIKESDAEEIMCKMICQEANVSYSQMRFEPLTMTPPQHRRVQDAIKYFHTVKNQMYMFGGCDWEHSCESIEAQLESLEAQGIKIDLMFCDYVQNLKVPARISSRPRYQQVEWLTESMANIHRRFDIAGVLLSQLNRSIDGEPHLHNLKEASKIEEESSMITFLHREKSVGAINSMLETSVYCEKNRNGELWGMRDGNFIMNVPSTHFSTKLNKYDNSYNPQGVK